MQIFALFMFLGLLVSFLVPETKGYTLEELAGERPTSYNSGRNGSIVEKPKKWWNPFGGGRPAGFMYPRSAQVQLWSWRSSGNHDESRTRSSERWKEEAFLEMDPSKQG